MFWSIHPAPLLHRASWGQPSASSWNTPTGSSCSGQYTDRYASRPLPMFCAVLAELDTGHRSASAGPSSPLRGSAYSNLNFGPGGYIFWKLYMFKKNRETRIYSILESLNTIFTGICIYFTSIDARSRILNGFAIKHQHNYISWYTSTREDWPLA